ncbi:PREDICTED: putative C-_U-editing enzyme APOBEC-4 [Calidris pugnax]|uniref:putative C->U-editing enzyme APOBEC-4 n=1 Tax=Calidris pugnax TaxID=198806 RepID=UPI00071D559B|nr:PREDICTED: putative C->U-editing enzyme APOBEC-4 [Calidris pugnax]XP_014803851.1 PREDICTED: putative C->U-editing enzyme APOBEC-4 [Calidris pugnax]XP_014803858.1 PREDICTED: putative C->U-editing enzyme APOBEC-4 [Calidris pugnax]XP_014803865.1 PREDICTED: putative C->U-editing enzyme APOBEC-4 [Calidris pugnax]XP_014803872.1 PREDICTED: putative C->U-editing enzyme APOBEC-4 [Calidris pugnax]
MNPGEKKIFQEYLTSQGTVVKPYCWQRQNHNCAKCPYHIRTGEEARVPHAEFHRVFGFPYRSTATLQNKHLLFYELRSFSGTVVQKGHATNCTDQDNHPESMLFEVGGYLDAVTDAYENIRHIILYSNYSPCNEAYHCCVSKIYNFLLRYPEITLCIYFSQLYHTEDGFPTAAWNREALWSLSSLWPQVTLQRLPEGTRHYLLCNFVYSVPGSTLYHPTPPLNTSADLQNTHQNNLTGMKLYFKKPFPQGMQRKPAVQQNLKAFYSPSPASQQPSQAMKGSLLPPMSQSHLGLFPGMFLPFQREHLSPRPKNIIRHLKMPKE